MKQETVKVNLLAVDTDTDVLQFQIDDKKMDVNLNSPECQGSLKQVFAALLEKAIDTDISLELSVDEEYSRSMYREVCTAYVDDLKRELAEITEELRRELTK